MSKEKSSPSRPSASPSASVLPKTAPVRRHSTSIEDVMQQVRQTRSPESEGVGDITLDIIRKLIVAGAILGGINWYYGYEKERVAKEDAQAQAQTQAVHEAERAELIEIQRKGQEEVQKILHPEPKPELQREPHRAAKVAKASPKPKPKKHKASKSKKPTRVDGAIM